jgi:hypothetical protein
VNDGWRNIPIAQVTGTGQDNECYGLIATTTMRTRGWIFVELAVIVLGLLAWVAVWATKHRLAQEGQELLATLVDLSDSKDFGAVQRKYGTRLHQLPHCVPGDCSYEVVINNRLLAAMHLGTFTELRARFDVSHTDLVMSLVDYRTAPRGEAGSMVHVQTDYSCSASCSYFYVHPWQDTGLTVSRINPWEGSSSNNGIVEFGYATDRVNRTTALSLNLGCLTGAVQCDNIAQLLPTVWKNVDARLVRCRIPNQTGTVE